MKTCCFTGHRKIPYSELDQVMQKLNKEIRKAMQKGVDTFICGGALGFDKVCAELILKLKETEKNLKLMLVLPCQARHKFWGSKTREKYQFILSAADAIIYISDAYFKDCRKKRNERMVALSDMCIAYLRKKISGTGQTVHMAERKNIVIVKL